MIPASQVQKLQRALPFWLSLSLLPLIWLAATQGGWALILPPLGTWWLYSFLDVIFGANKENADLETTEEQLFWYRLITLIWFPIQVVVIYGTLWYATSADHLSGVEKMVLFFDVGILSGTVGIVYAHELMHQKNRVERWLADLLLATVLYSHFRTEHLLVHHPYVGTPRDGVTARYNEGFHRYFVRVMRTGVRSAWRAEKAMLARKGVGPLDGSNPFWRYGALQAAALGLAVAIGGWAGLGLFLIQAYSAIWQLELTNYIEHYGLTRKYLGKGKYEYVQPRHSWNAAQMASNWLLLNLQRHSDHHHKPSRRFPLLQNYNESEAPQLPFGYPVMTIVAMVPPFWRRVMNPRVRKWRAMYYPEITDWKPYAKGLHPNPR